MDTQQNARAVPSASHFDKTTLLLHRDRILFLDDLSLRIRRDFGVVVPRSAIIRALVDGFYLSKITFTKVESEDDLAQTLARCLYRGAADPADVQST